MPKTQKGAALDSSFYLTKSHLNNKLFRLFSGYGYSLTTSCCYRVNHTLCRVQVTDRYAETKSRQKNTLLSPELCVGLLDVCSEREKKTEPASLLHQARNMDFMLKLMLPS